MTTIDHVCLSRNLSCSGVRPCEACFDFLRGGRIQGQLVWPSGGVVTRMLFLGGPQFTSRETAEVLMRAYAQAVADSITFLHQVLTVNPQAHRAYRTVTETSQGLSEETSHVAPSPEPRMLTEQEHLAQFRDSLLEGLEHMTEAERSRMVEGVRSETLEGWSHLTAHERMVLKQVLCGPSTNAPPAGDEEVPEGDFPSNETGAKVVAALRNGTLNEHTLDPPKPRVVSPELQAEALASVSLPEAPLPAAAPGVDTSVGDTGMVNQEAPAQVAEAHEESNT